MATQPLTTNLLDRNVVNLSLSRVTHKQQQIANKHLHQSNYTQTAVLSIREENGTIGITVCNRRERDRSSTDLSYSRLF